MNNYLEAWLISHRMNEHLLVGINEAHLTDTGSKGRSVGEQFAHIHNVRLMWIKAALPSLMDGQIKIEKEDKLSKKLLFDRLEQSAKGISGVMEDGFKNGRVKGFKPHPEAFLAYMVAHEAHHRGQIILILKENKHLPDNKTLYGLWEWGTK